jgi:hypothetical protein
MTGRAEGFVKGELGDMEQTESASEEYARDPNTENDGRKEAIYISSGVIAFSLGALNCAICTFKGR